MAEQKPLWLVMRNAYDRSSVPTDLIEASDPQTGDCLTDRFGYAAEIRALADEVVPEEWPSDSDWEPAYKMHERHQRQRIRQRLLDAATEAEDGQ